MHPIISSLLLTDEIFIYADEWTVDFHLLGQSRQKKNRAEHIIYGTHYSCALSKFTVQCKAANGK